MSNLASRVRSLEKLVGPPCGCETVALIPRLGSTRFAEPNAALHPGRHLVVLYDQGTVIDDADPTADLDTLVDPGPNHAALVEMGRTARHVIVMKYQDRDINGVVA